MALKAGYVGVKRWLYEKLQATTAKNVQDIVDIWSNNNETGAKNLLENKATTGSVAGISTTVNSDGTISLGAGTTTGSYYKIIQGGFASSHVPVPDWLVKGQEYIISDGNTDTTPYLAIWFYDNSEQAISGFPVYQGKFTVPDTAVYYLIALYMPGSTTISAKKIYPMITPATNPNATYAPYAMTNQQLTVSALDQKTAINAIITAATGAADFAAFKTAMGAITPVTRSAAPDTREVIEDDPEPVTKTTRSTKKTATTKEGE